MSIARQANSFRSLQTGIVYTHNRKYLVVVHNFWHLLLFPFHSNDIVIFVLCSHFTCEQVRNIYACEISKVFTNHTFCVYKHRDRIVLDWMLYNTYGGNKNWTIHCGDYNEKATSKWKKRQTNKKKHNKLPAYGMRSFTMKLEWSVFVVFLSVFFCPQLRATTHPFYERPKDQTYIYLL